MAAPNSSQGQDTVDQRNLSNTGSQNPHRFTEGLATTEATNDARTTSQREQIGGTKKRRNHRGGRKKKTRRQSFAVGNEEEGTANPARSTHELHAASTSGTPRPPFYRLGQSGRNLSSASLDSQALLDHRYAVRQHLFDTLRILTDVDFCRDHPPMRPRRESRLMPSAFGPRPEQHRPSHANHHPSNDRLQRRQQQPYRGHASSGGESDEGGAETTDRTPLLASATHDSGQPDYSLFTGQGRNGRHDSQQRRPSTPNSISSKQRRDMLSRRPSSGPQQSYDVNNPPSVPGSPKLGSDMGFDDVMVTGSVPTRNLDHRHGSLPVANDQLIDIDGDGNNETLGGSSPPSPRREAIDHRRRTIALPAEEDVCFPLEGMSAIGEDDYSTHDQAMNGHTGPRRRRYRQWPDLSVLEEWSREEKEVRSDGIRAKKISEPVLVGGRLRPQKYSWHRTEEDAPYRFTYFNEELPSTIHSQTISELLQPGQDFRELFIPDPPELSDESSDDEDFTSHQGTANERQGITPISQSRAGTRHPSVAGDAETQSRERSGDATPQQSNGTQLKEKEKRYGARPTFWLDVLSPTDTEMRVISKTFGIHPLTAEDIMMQEAREKVELFRNYYFVNYRTFEQDVNSGDYLEPVNMYVVVFREGVISFHFSMTPHPANVRRRIRQLKDYLILSSDWISYAIIDDITDVFAPLIQTIEEEVDDIDDQILKLHSGEKEINEKPNKDSEKRSVNGDLTNGDSGGDMLRRVGEGRKKVMGLYRLLGNKADVIKGFAKRCNEHWDIAPRSEIGLYLGDIQDHILTMTSNLSHYET